MMDDRLTGKLPLFAVLRGINPEDAVGVASALVAAGFAILEVTMNSPEPMQSITAIKQAIGDNVLLGGGTVTTAAEVDAIGEAGGQLIVSPHCDAELIAYASKRGMVTFPGVLTPTEMFGALKAGATGLKIFPAELFSPQGIKAVKAVLPPATPIYVVGGIHAGNMADYLLSGATGFGFGGSLYRPGQSSDQVFENAKALVEAFAAAADSP